MRVITQKENGSQRVVLWDLGTIVSHRADAVARGDIQQRVDLFNDDQKFTVALTKGGYRIRYDAGDDTLHIGCDESNTGDPECHALLGSTTMSELGMRMVGNVHFCSTRRILTRIEQYLDITAPTTVEFFVYEAHDDTILALTALDLPEPADGGLNFIDPATDDFDERHRHARDEFAGAFDLVARSTIEIAAGQGFHSSEPLSVELKEGKFYLIGAAWSNGAMHFWDTGHPVTTPFGHSLRGFAVEFSGSSVPTTVFAPTSVLDERLHYQRLTLDGRGFDPDGGGELFIIDNDSLPYLKVGTINATGAGLEAIFSNVAIGRVIGGPVPQFFGGSIDPTAPALRYSVRSSPIVFRVRRGSPDTCRCSRKFYMEPTIIKDFATEDDAREFFDDLEPVARAAIGVVPDETITATGCRTGPFIPGSISYEVVNTGELPVNWTAFPSESWLQVTPASGTFLNPGERTAVEAVINADSLCTGFHTAQIFFTNQTNGLGTTIREIVLDVRGEPSPMIVPDEPFNTLGSLGGPFLPVFMDWIVTNTDDCPMTFGITHATDWVDLSTETETLAPGESVVVTATINTEANSLPPGRHEDRLIFRNLTSGREVFGRSVVLRVSV